MSCMFRQRTGDVLYIGENDPNECKRLEWLFKLYNFQTYGQTAVHETNISFPSIHVLLQGRTDNSPLNAIVFCLGRMTFDFDI